MAINTEFIRYFYTNTNGSLLQCTVCHNKESWHISNDITISSHFIPDINTLFPDPFTHIPIKNIICDINHINCTRTRLRNTLLINEEYLLKKPVKSETLTSQISSIAKTETAKVALIFRFALFNSKENEIDFLQNQVDKTKLENNKAKLKKKTTIQTLSKGISINDLFYNIRSELVHELSKIGIVCIEHYHESMKCDLDYCLSDLHTEKSIKLRNRDKQAKSIYQENINAILIDANNLMQVADNIQIIKYYIDSISNSYNIASLIYDNEIKYTINIANNIISSINNSIFHIPSLQNPYTAIAEIIKNTM